LKPQASIWLSFSYKAGQGFLPQDLQKTTKGFVVECTWVAAKLSSKCYNEGLIPFDIVYQLKAWKWMGQRLSKRAKLLK